MNDIKQDYIDRYIRGEMNSEEQKSFEKQIEEDEELREMFRYTKKVSEVVKDRNEKLERINRWKSEESRQKSVKFHNTLTGRVVYGILGIAAVVAIVLYFNRCPSMPELDESHYECYRGYGSVTHVVRLLKEKRYDNAMYVIENTEKECISEKDSITKLIPAASSESVKRMEYELSANKLDYDEMQWLKVYAYIGLKRYTDARELLKDISSESGIYAEKADSLLRKL